MRFISLLLAALLSFAAHAKPSPEEVKRVVDYYQNGKDQGVVLADVKLCEAVPTEGELKNECQGERDPLALTVGEPVTVWMMFMVPSGMDQQDIMLQLNYQGLTRAVEKATVASSLRYRVWRKVTLDRPGEWTASIIHDSGQGLELLREMKMQVQPKAAQQ